MGEDACIFVHVKVELEEWVVAVGEQETTKKSAREIPGLKPFRGGGALLSLKGL